MLTLDLVELKLTRLSHPDDYIMQLSTRNGRCRYPILVMPIYRSKVTLDGHRLMIVCVIHPIVHELTMTVQRVNGLDSYLLRKTVNDLKRMHFALASLGAASFLDAIFIMYRRFMLW